jgi:hypothetical protein
MAELNPDPPLAAVDHPRLRTKPGLAKIARSRPEASGPVTRRLARAEGSGGCSQFGWIDNGQTRSTAMSRRHIASSWSMGWPTLTGGIER